MIFNARDLIIAWGNDERYWHWDRVEEPKKVEIEVARLLQVWWLDVSGTLGKSYLMPGATYAVFFIVKIEEESNGWNVPVDLRLETPDGEIIERREILQNYARNEWVGIPVGSFTNPANDNGTGTGELKFFLSEQSDDNPKKGLVIKGVSIQPK